MKKFINNIFDEFYKKVKFRKIINWRNEHRANVAYRGIAYRSVTVSVKMEFPPGHPQALTFPLSINIVLASCYTVANLNQF